MLENVSSDTKRGKLLNIVSLFGISLLIAYILSPLVSYLGSKGLSKLSSLIVTYIFLISSITMFLLYGIPLFKNEIQEMLKLIPKYVGHFENVFDYVRENQLYKNLPVSVQKLITINMDYLNKKMINILQNTMDNIIHMFPGLLTAVIAPIISFYLLKDTEKIKSKLLCILPERSRYEIIELCREVDSVLSRYLRGQLIMCAAVGVMTTFGLLLLNIDNAMIIGTIVGASNIIPYFGPFLGALPAIIIAAIQSPKTIFWVIFILISVQQIENCIIAPKILGDSVGLHPVIIIIVLIYGGSVFGFWGLVLSVPIVAIIKVILIYILNRLARVDKG